MSALHGKQVPEQHSEDEELRRGVGDFLRLGVEFYLLRSRRLWA